MSDKQGHQLPNVIYPGILDRAEMVDWVERFYGEYYFRPKAAWRIVRKAMFDGNDRKRLYKEAKSYLSLRHKRKKYVAEYKAAGSIRPRSKECGDGGPKNRLSDEVGYAECVPTNACAGRRASSWRW